MREVILIRYGELSLKGKNRFKFEDRLLHNIRQVLSDLSPREVKKTYGRMYVELKDDLEAVVERLRRVFGLVSFSPALVVPLEMEAIKQAAISVMQKSGRGRTFKVETKRPYKPFPFKSPEISREVGGHILEKIEGWSVDVHHPETMLEVEVREEGAFVYCEKIPCAGGLPLGSSGKALLLLSGGIDSPVAGWLGMKRGVEMVGLHFFSFPFTSERSKEKVIDLCKVLAKYCGSFKLYVNHFTEIQKSIRQDCPEEFYVTIMRRMMFRIAREVTYREKALALFTGESLGQVASQTMESMTAIGEVVDIPILRPLVTMDKLEIIRQAELIGTYDISIQPYEDCCTLFLPKHPSIKPKVDVVRRAEKSLDIEGLIADSLAKTKILRITPTEVKEVEA